MSDIFLHHPPASLVQALYRIGALKQNRVIRIYRSLSDSSDVFLIRRGKVLATGTKSYRSSGNKADLLQRLSRLFDANIEIQVEAGPIFPPGNTSTYVDLAKWIRSYCESHISASRARDLFQELSSKALYLQKYLVPKPENTFDRYILGKLAAPTTLSDLLAHTGIPHSRIAAFLFFAKECGILCTESPTRKKDDVTTIKENHKAPTHYELLGIPRSTNEFLIRKAYLKCVRSFHPDLHPQATKLEQRALEEKLRAATNAYKQLCAELGVNVMHNSQDPR